MIKAVFFDLDGTLVPCDTNDFVKGYFKLLVKYLMKREIDAKDLPDRIMRAVFDVLKTDGSMTNKEMFWKNFYIYSNTKEEDKKEIKRVIDEFYETDFDNAKDLLSDIDPMQNEVLDYLKNHDILRVIATSPIFPRAATAMRIKWIGHKYEEFDHVTTYDNCIHAKPSLEYYKDLLKMFALKADEVLMVGNDIKEDMLPAQTLGMDTFLIERFILNDELEYKGKKGNFEDLLNYLKEIL